MRLVVFLVLSILTAFSCDYLKRGRAIEDAPPLPDSLHKIEYNSFEAAYKRDPNLKELSSTYNLQWILLLDSTYADAIYQFEPKLKKEVDLATAACKPNKHTVGFVTEVQNLKELLLDRKANKMILQCTLSKTTGPVTDKIGDLVYINGNSAIITIEGPTYFSIYHIALRDQIIQLNLIERVIE